MFKYVRTVANQNCIQEEFKSRLNSGNACYHSVHNFLSSCLLSKNKIKIYRNTMLLVLYRCELDLMLKEEHRQRVFENRVLRSFVTCKVIPLLFFLTENHAMKVYWGVEV
jgi:hypothetical protein